MPSRLACAAALSVLTVFGSVASGLAQQPNDSPAPRVPQTTLDVFAARPEARTTWLRRVGDVRSPSAYLLVSAVELQTPDRRLRGVRLEPRHEGGLPPCGNWPYTEWQVLCEQENPRVYVEESDLLDFIEGTRQGAARIADYMAVSRTTSRTRDAGANHGYVILGYTFSEDAGAELTAILTAAQETLQQRP